ncbi:MAG: hypothetical protein L6Q98_04100 [Anaerolineae bacterium]|nr:hypothetical protein [Anaerolineae bacterium]NUQ07191.1 hypothetical protein [Anaerolineae bacterium]
MKQRSFTIAQLEQIAAMGEGSGHLASCDQSGNVTFYAAPPAQRDIRREIFDVVLHKTRAQEWCDRGYVRRVLGLKSTKWLHDHMDRLVSEGYLVRVETVQTNGMKHYWYAVAPAAPASE